MRRTRRPGLSLTEVLVALFVMALGLMALLTLFPLGAMQVGQALKDDRTAQTAQLGDAWVRAYWRGLYPGDFPEVPGDPLPWAMDNPNLLDRRLVTVSQAGGFNPLEAAVHTYVSRPSTAVPPRLPLVGGSMTQLPPAPPSGGAGVPLDAVSLLADVYNSQVAGLPAPAPAPLFPGQQAVYGLPAPRINRLPGYPVLLDPLGYLARPGTGYDRYWVGLSGQGVYGTAYANTPMLLPRRTVADLLPSGAAQANAYAAAALTDDLTFQGNGGAGQSVNGGPLEPLNRQGRYHWAAVLHRFEASDTLRTELTILVFDGRPAFLAAPDDEVVLTGAFVTGGTAGGRSLELLVPTRGTDQPPLVRRGGWVAVASMDTAPEGTRGISFHRVTGLTTQEPEFVDRATGAATAGGISVTRTAVDIDPPLPVRVSAAPQVYLFAGLSEVFPGRSPLTPR